MNVHGRHLMINCEGEGQTPPVSEEGFLDFMTKHLMANDDLDLLSIISPEEIKTILRLGISAYEKGKR